MASCWSVRSSRPHQSLSFLSDFFFKKENKSYVVRMCLHKYWFVSVLMMLAFSTITARRNTELFDKTAFISLTYNSVILINNPI